jgi:cysteine-rich repeat protein
LNNDVCFNICVFVICGDGFVEVGAESCDDANGSNTDACLNTCVTATCGDGFIELGVEGCDDANEDDSDACLTSCQVASCGDGYVEAGVEACDDGNSDDYDGCSTSCVSGICGDGMVQSESEECDDGNDDDLDGCSTSCMMDLVVNGSFEEPALQNHSWNTFDTIIGWQRSFGPKIEIQNNVAGTAHHGDQFCELDSHSSTGIYQDIETTPGQTYDFGFYFSARPGVQLHSNRMEILWDGEVVATVEADGSGQSSTQWQLYQYEVTATATTTRIEFRDVGQSDSLGSYLDAISVSRILD